MNAKCWYSFSLKIKKLPPNLSMKKTASLLFSTIALLIPLESVVSATLSVLPGNSIQEKINAAQTGDVVAIFGGNYSEDLTINKSIRLVEVSGQNVILRGSVTFSGLVDPQPFEGFTQGSSGRGISIANTTGLTLKNIDARDGSGISITGNSSVRILSSQSSSISTSAQLLELVDTSTTGGLSQSAGTMHVFRCTIGEHIVTTTGAQKTVAFRTTVTGDNTWRSKKAWFGYCDTRSFNFIEQNDAKVVVVGCKIDRQNGQANGIFIQGTNTNFIVSNNICLGVAYAHRGFYGEGSNDNENGIAIRGLQSGLISNNFCSLTYGQHDNGVRGDGIYAPESTNIKIINNIIVGAKFGVTAPFGATVKNNLYWDSPWGSENKEAGGAVAQGTIYADPKFVPDQAPALATDSPCINAGDDDPIFANRDGSRNTIGPSGGSLFDPDARTTENPVVISFDLGPEQVLEGEDTTILLSNGQAVSQP